MDYFATSFPPYFVSEKTRSLLLASDVAARGLDIPNVDHVIHYQVPRTVEVNNCKNDFSAIFSLCSFLFDRFSLSPFLPGF